MTLLFISYSSKDRQFALKLAESLRDSGYDVWIDRWNITGREPYWDEIQHGIESATHFLFLVSPESIASDSGARRELYHAGGLKPTPVFIPVLVRTTPFEDFPILISPGQYQIHDFVQQPWEVAYEQVMKAIQVGETVNDSLLKRVDGVLAEFQAQDDPDSIASRRSSTKMKKDRTLPKPPRSAAAVPEETPQRRGRAWLTIFIVALLGVLVVGGIIFIVGNLNPQAVADQPTQTVALPTQTNTLPPTETPTQHPTLTPTPPSSAATQMTAPASPPDATLFYDATQLVLVNVSKRSVNASRLVFVQDGAENRVSFSASKWPQPNLSPQRCFEVARDDRTLPDPLKGCTRDGWIRVGATQQFWIVRDLSVTTFKVLLDNQEIKTCDIKAGQCDLALP